MRYYDFLMDSVNFFGPRMCGCFGGEVQNPENEKTAHCHGYFS